MGLEFGNPERPEADNLLGLYAILSGRGREAVAAECSAMGWGQFKPLLAEAAVEALRPVQERYREWRSDPAALLQVLETGRSRPRPWPMPRWSGFARRWDSCRQAVHGSPEPPPET